MTIVHQTNQNKETPTKETRPKLQTKNGNTLPQKQQNKQNQNWKKGTLAATNPKHHNEKAG